MVQILWYLQNAFLMVFVNHQIYVLKGRGKESIYFHIEKINHQYFCIVMKENYLQLLGHDHCFLKLLNLLELLIQ